MADQRDIAVSNLLLDLENPRLAEGQDNQPGTIQAMLRAEGPKTLALTQSIAEEGLSPTERLIVIPALSDQGRYIVLEGNRRLTALRILAEPSMAAAVLTVAQQKKLQAWSASYRKRGEVHQVECSVFATREEANPWIERRHRGDQGGLGIVRWGATEQARFDARRTGKRSAALQVLDYVAQHAALDPATREKLHNVPITNLKRLIADKAVRARLGLELDRSGRMLTRFPEKETLKGLVRIVQDLAHDRIKVADIYKEADRRKYLGRFKPSERPTATTALPSPRPLIGDGQVATQPASAGRAGKKTAHAAKPRRTLIPATCVLNVSLPKLQNIQRELRGLKLEDYPNAAAVLFRVFVELSVDGEIEKHTLLTPQELEGATLSKKLVTVATHLEGAKRLTKDQAKAVKKAASDQPPLHSSVKTFHQYVHNKHLSPSPTDLRAGWDNLQPLLEAIWA